MGIALRVLGLIVDSVTNAWQTRRLAACPNRTRRTPSERLPGQAGQTDCLSSVALAGEQKPDTTESGLGLFFFREKSTSDRPQPDPAPQHDLLVPYFS